MTTAKDREALLHEAEARKCPLCHVPKSPQRDWCSCGWDAQRDSAIAAKARADERARILNVIERTCSQCGRLTGGCCTVEVDTLHQLDRYRHVILRSLNMPSPQKEQDDD